MKVTGYHMQIKIRIAIYLTFILFFLNTRLSFGQDPFLPYMDGKAPIVVKELGTEDPGGGLRVRKVVFRSRTVETPQGPEVSLVYAAIVYPPGTGRHPALLRLHGGGGNADIPSAIESARAGYVSMVLDIPGIAGKGRSPENTINWNGIPKIRAKPNPTYSALFDAVLASLQSFYLLRAQDEVDPERMAIAGASWGGYTATMLATLLDKQIVCTYSAYGSGCFMDGAYEKQNIEKLPEAEKERFIKYLDPGSRARHITRPYMIATASNDRHWSWMAVQALLKQVRAERYVFYSPNDNHMMKYPGNGLMMPFLDHYLKAAKGLPVIEILKSKTEADGQYISYRVVSDAKILNTKVFYTKPSIQPVWTDRVWLHADGHQQGKVYRALIPGSSAAGPINYYVMVTVERQGNKEDALSVSSWIKELNEIR